jgi:glycosyltransferase involved in cell wall biosynthesis
MTVPPVTERPPRGGMRKRGNFSYQRRPKLLLLATEDWFVRSHFLPLIERAATENFDVVVAARSTGVDLGPARLVPMPFDRGAMGLDSFLRELAAVRAVLESEQASIVHAISLKPIAQLLFSPKCGAGRVYAVTGRGYLAANSGVPVLALSSVLARRLRSAVLESDALLGVENEADRRWVEGSKRLPDDRVFMMPGAGVDVLSSNMLPEPPARPVIVGVASRLVRSKGTDLVVQAVQRLRKLGEDIELQIAGAVDRDNPDHIKDEELERWARAPGVKLLGHVQDINAFWAGVHISCLASRGGEGLPRALLEAAACGRPIVATDVPGCADFIGKDAGIVVARDNPDALATALLKLSWDGAARRRMGASAHQRVVAGYTTRHAADSAMSAWRRVLTKP